MRWLIKTWRKLIHGLWFRPALVALVFVVLALLLPLADDRGWSKDVPFIYGGGPATARTLLATIAGSLMTVLALVFSLTLIAMQLVSSQLTPRALRGFLGARMTQLAAGFFIGTVLYCFLVMRHIRSALEEGSYAVPQMSVTVGLLLGLLAMAYLLAFVNHIASWMQLSSIIRRIAQDTLLTVEREFPDEAEDESTTSLQPPDSAGLEVVAVRSGFVQYFVASRRQMEAPEPAEFVQMLVDTGDFVVEGQPLMKAWAREDTVELRDELRGLVVIGDERDVRQDVRFGLRQLSDIGLRGLSPGVNDPTTAVACLNYIKVILCRLASRRLIPTIEADRPRPVLLPDRSFEDCVAESLAEFVQFSADQPRVAREVHAALKMIEERARQAGFQSRAEALVVFRSRCLAHAIDNAPSDYARQELSALTSAS